MNLDDLLHDAVHDDRWALPVPPDALEGLRRGRALRRRQRAAACSVAAVLAVAGGAFAIVAAIPHHRVQLGTFAGSGGVPAGWPAPGITPAFVPTSGRDWLMTTAEYATYARTHTHPSPPPGQSSVASPAPLTEQSAELLADVQAADLPAGAKLRREDSAGGEPGVAQVHITLADGTPVLIERRQLVEPFPYDAGNPAADGSTTDPNPNPPTLVDVPGTTSAALVVSIASQVPAANTVNAFSRGGVSTYWFAAAPVTLDQLKAWAFAAAVHEVG